jgi:hypothetical protein
MVSKILRMMRIAAFLVVIAFVFEGLASAANDGQEPVGARPIGMGSTFVGIADDGNALYWNPAGMAFLKHHEITIMHSDIILRMFFQ